MFLNPAEPVWPGLAKAALVLTLFVASGVPLAWAVFGDRPRQVWIGYAPVMGIGLHLLTANLSAWVAPGVVGSWLGLVTALAAAALVAARVRLPVRRPSWTGSTWVWPGAGVLLIASLAYLALANRTHVLFTDEQWHLPLAASMARGFFPPISPVAPAFGAAYHYGSDLLAVSLMNVAGIAPWTAFFFVTPLAALVFSLTAASAALDFGASRLAALCVGLIAAFADSTVVAGLPTVLSDLTSARGLGDVLLGFGIPVDAPLFKRMGPTLLNLPHFALGMTILILMAAAVHAGHRQRHAVVLGVCLGLLPLAETAAFLIGAVGAVAYLAVARRRWTRRERGTFAAAVAGGLLLAALGGGTLTDTLFRNPGGAGTRLGLSPDTSVLIPGVLSPAGGLNLELGALPLVAGLTLMALTLRSRGLGFLATAAIGGLVVRQVLHFEVTGVDTRLLGIPYTLAALGAVSALGTLASRARPTAATAVGSVVLAALVTVPTVAPRLISGVDIATQGVYLGYPVVQDAEVQYANQTSFAASLRDEWHALAWMRRELPDDARVLAENAPLVAATTGLASPQSGRGLALFNPLPTPVHLDALRFLSRIDLEALDATHIYVTPSLLGQLDAQARADLDDPKQFRLLASHVSASGEPLLVYAVQPGAGREQPSPASFRQLAALGHQAPARTLSGFPSFPQRQTVLLTFAPEYDVEGPDTYMPRTNIRARYEASGSRIKPGLVILHETHVPLALGQGLDDAVWQGHELRAYSTEAGAWSRTWRAGTEPQPPPGDIAERHGLRDAGCELLVIGEPGDSLTVGDRALRLSGLPQTMSFSSLRCDTLSVAWGGGDVPPFVQVRARRSDARLPVAASAGLAFDGGVSNGIGVFHVWYRNPDETPVAGGSELRLYRVRADGLIDATSPTQSVAWWLGPIELSKARFTDRFEFDAAKLMLNGELPLELSSPLVDGGYVLTLNVSQRSEDTQTLHYRRVIPVMQVTLQNGRPTYRPLSGIVGVS